jgi:hypothetical protein
MKLLLLTPIILLCLALPCIAEPIKIEVQFTLKNPSGDILSSPKVITRDGQRANIKVTREHMLDGDYTLPTGVILDITSKEHEGKIIASGHFTLRESLSTEESPQANIMDFRTREFVFKVHLKSGDSEEVTLSDDSSVLISLKLANKE